jgi:hypothetical protein
MTTNLDIEFNSIQNLKWLPWIGDDYLNSPNKLLLIGESHYYNPEKKESFEKHQNIGYTREVIEKVAINKEYKTYKKKAPKIFPNIHFTFLGNDNIATKSFWNKVGFYNFVQVPMKTNQGRPTKNDYTKGWEHFDEIINIVKHDTCIFLGNSSSQYFSNSLIKSNTKISSKLTNIGKVNNAMFKETEIKLHNGQKVAILFIRHPSNFFSWKKWNNQLTNKVPNLMNWLKA